MKVELTVEELKTILDGLYSAKELTCFMNDFIRYDELEKKIDKLLQK